MYIVLLTKIVNGTATVELKAYERTKQQANKVLNEVNNWINEQIPDTYNYLTQGHSRKTDYFTIIEINNEKTVYQSNIIEIQDNRAK